MAKSEIRLDKIGVCLACGAPEYLTHLTGDHCLPRCLMKKPEITTGFPNPFRRVVLMGANKFRLCESHHISLDRMKIEAFSADGFKTLDPENLIEFLAWEYPITDDPRYQLIQVLNLIATMKGFAETSFSLNGEFPHPLVDKYHRAAKKALEFAEKLKLLKAVK